MTFPVAIIDQLQRQREDHREEDRADELRPAGDDHPRAHPGAEELTDAHDESPEKHRIPSYEKDRERTQVAPEIHHFRVAGRLGHVEAQPEHERHGPKRARAWAEEAVIKTKRQTEDQIEPS